LSILLKTSEIDFAHKVHTKQIQRCSLGDLATEGSRAGGDWSSTGVNLDLEPKVRPPPLIGAIPNASFFRKLISVCTIVPRPRGLRPGPVDFWPDPPLVSGECVIEVEPEATCSPHDSPSSPSSEEISIMSLNISFDPVALFWALKLKSFSNCVHALLETSFCLRSTSCSDDKKVCRRSASVSAVNSASSSENSSSLAKVGAAEVPALGWALKSKLMEFQTRNN